MRYRNRSNLTLPLMCLEPGEDRQQMLLRSVVLSYGGSHGLIKDVIDEATRQFHSHLNDEQGAMVHPDLLTLVYNLAVKYDP
jgi:hypothetical protein